MAFSVGDIVEGKITGITNFGVFVDLGEGKSGLVHISEVAQTYVSDIKEFVKIGDEVKMKILTVSDDGKISLSIKQAQAPKQKVSELIENMHAGEMPHNLQEQLEIYKEKESK